MRQKIVAGIDIGTAAIRVVVVSHNKNEQTKILASVVEESRGMRHGYIVNFDEAVESIRSAIDAAESKIKMRIDRAFLGIGGISLSSATCEASIAISKSDGEVSEQDIKRVLELCESNFKHNPNNRIVHTIPLQYKLDGKKVLGKPLGMHGSLLDVKILFVTCLDQHLETLVKAVEAARVRVEDVAASPIAASIVTLTKHQRVVGCALANVGAETLTLSVFEENLPISVHVFPLGSTDITNDIALGLKVPLDEAEDMKLHRENTVSSRKKLDEIIVARLTDMFELIDTQLKKVGRSGLLPAGIILTGGGSQLDMIEQLAKSSLKLPAKVASIVHPKDMSSDTSEKQQIQIKDSTWAVAYGLCILGLATEDDDAMHVKLIQQTKNSFIGWIQKFLP